MLWDVAGQKLLHRFPGAGPKVAFAPDSRSLFTVGDLILHWDVATGKLLDTDLRSHCHVGEVWSATFAPDGKALATNGDDATTRSGTLTTKAIGFCGPIRLPMG